MLDDGGVDENENSDGPDGDDENRSARKPRLRNHRIIFFIIFYLNVLSEVYEEEEQADQAPPTPCSMSGLSVAGDPNAKETTVNPLNEDDACFEEENGKKAVRMILYINMS